MLGEYESIQKFSANPSNDSLRAMYIEVAMEDCTAIDQLISAVVRAKNLTSLHLGFAGPFYSQTETRLDKQQLLDPRLRLLNVISTSLPRLRHVSLSTGVWPIRTEMVMCWPPTLLSLDLRSTTWKGLDSTLAFKIEPSWFPLLKSLILDLRVVFWGRLPIEDPEEGEFEDLEHLSLENCASELVSEMMFDLWLVRNLPIIIFRVGSRIFSERTIHPMSPNSAKTP